MSRIRILIFNSRKYDFSTSGLIQGLNELDNVKLYVTNPGCYALPEQVLPREEVLSYAEMQADFVVLGSNHYVDHDTFWKINSGKAKKIYIDGWDSGQLNVYPLNYHKLDFIFKVNLYKRDNSLANFMRILIKKDLTLWGIPRSHFLFPYPLYHSMKNNTGIKDIIKNILFMRGQERVLPLPFAVEKRCQQDFNSSPRYMLSCMLSADRVPERQKIIDMLNEMNLKDLYIGKIDEAEDDYEKMLTMHGADPDVPRDERGYAFHNDDYYEQIRQSRACISVPGGGFDTFRFWEILGAGALLISKRIALRMPDPPVENKHYLAFDTPEELKACIKRLYGNTSEIDDIRRAGYEYARQYHTTRTRAEYFIGTITATGSQ